MNQTIPQPGKPWEISLKKRSASASLIILAVFLAGAAVKFTGLDGKLEVIRGKRPAHARETELINTLQPALNTFGVK